MANEFIARNGLIANNTSSISGDLTVSGKINGTASYALSSAINGGTANYIPFWVNSNTISSSAIYQQGSTISINTSSFTTLSPEVLFLNQANTSSFNLMTGVGLVNNYFQINVKNNGSGVSSSSDIVATANNGTETSLFIDMGINGSGFTGNGNGLGQANDAYLYSTGKNLYLGNLTTSSLYFFSNQSGTPDMVLTGSRFGIGKSGNLNATLDINGNEIISGSSTATLGYTGSLFGSSSYALAINESASYTWGGIHQFNSIITASAGLAKGMLIIPILQGVANSNTLVALDISASFPSSSFTNTQNLGLRITGTSNMGTGFFGMQIIDANDSSGNIALLTQAGAGFSLPGFYMGQYALAPTISNYCFRLDDANNGTEFNAPGAFNPITFQIQNVTRMKIQSGSGNVTISNGTGLALDDRINNVQVSGSVKAGWFLTKPPSLSAINSTATVTAAQLIKGVITSTSAATVTLTLPTATLLAAALPAAQGTIFDFVIDNSAGANIVTLAAGSGMTVLAIITGSNTLTTAAGSCSIWRLYFSSTTAARLVRSG